eukprot:GHRR01003546.1.p4 GENE.GHRR01003546.1~~GHRR01003546.1.p4  ORF type:complete len:109 (-),score=38.32 GHRR01003546.1:897-1223(-)
MLDVANTACTGDISTYNALAAERQLSQHPPGAPFPGIHIKAPADVHLQESQRYTPLHSMSTCHPAWQAAIRVAHQHKSHQQILPVRHTTAPQRIYSTLQQHCMLLQNP